MTRADLLAAMLRRLADITELQARLLTDETDRSIEADLATLEADVANLRVALAFQP